jgi:hypothetical protein
MEKPRNPIPSIRFHNPCLFNPFPYQRKVLLKLVVLRREGIL